jgi:uncharacterized protein (TIGR02001 family)
MYPALRSSARPAILKNTLEAIMNKLQYSTLLALIGLTSSAFAEVSSTVTLTSDYDFRGISLSAKDPAIQASLDYANDGGFYVGAWASNADFGEGYDVDYEIDVYAGFSGGAEDGLGWDAGIVYYMFPGGQYPDGGDLDYPEIYAGLSYGMFSGKAWYSNDYSAVDEDGYYVEGAVAIPLPSNFSINLHAGYSFGDYWKDVIGDESLDYSAGVGYTAGHFNMELKYVDTETDVIVKDDAFNNEGRVLFSVETTFPWSEE